MTENTDKPLPRATLLLAQGSAQVSQNQKFVRESAFPKCAAPDSPSPGSAGKAQREGRVFSCFQTNTEAKIGRSASEQFIDRLPKQMFSGAVNEAKTVLGI